MCPAIDFLFHALLDHANRLPSVSRKFWMLLAAQGERGPAGSQGNRGRAATVGNSLTQVGNFETAAAVGQPVYITPAGKVALASAAAEATSGVVGLAASKPGTYATNGVVQRDDWTVVTGTAKLVPGQPYFLGLSPGTLGLDSPQDVGQVFAPVAVAVSPDALAIEIKIRVLL